MAEEAPPPKPAAIPALPAIPPIAPPHLPPLPSDRVIILPANDAIALTIVQGVQLLRPHVLLNHWPHLEQQLFEPNPPSYGLFHRRFSQWAEMQRGWTIRDCVVALLNHPSWHLRPHDCDEPNPASALRKGDQEGDGHCHGSKAGCCRYQSPD